MPTYKVVVTVDPPMLFGLPEEGWTVVEAGPGSRCSDAIDPRTGNVVEFGTLSRYRDYDDRLDVALSMHAIEFEARDNFFAATIVANDPREAVALVYPALRRFLAFASILLGTHLSYKLLQMTEDGVPVSFSESINVMRVHAYDLDHLKTNLIEASSVLDGLPIDVRLDQAFRYFTEGGDLFRLIVESELGRLLIPACFLQFWKSMATIVGDPSTDKDHQSRAKRLGLGNRYYAQVIRPLHGIRNQFDVAHIASLNAPAFVSKGDVERCRVAAAEVIQAHVRSLQGEVEAVVAPEATTGADSPTK